MLSVCSTESVVDINVSQTGQMLGIQFAAGLFACVKAQIFQHDNFAGLDLAAQTCSFLANGVEAHLDGNTQHVGQMLGNGCQGILHLSFALGLAQVRAEDNGSALIQQIADGGQCLTDTLVVGDGAVAILRYVKVAADQDLLALNVDVLNRFLIVLHRKSLSP